MIVTLTALVLPAGIFPASPETTMGEGYRLPRFAGPAVKLIGAAFVKATEGLSASFDGSSCFAEALAVIKLKPATETKAKRAAISNAETPIDFGEFLVLCEFCFFDILSPKNEYCRHG